MKTKLELRKDIITSLSNESLGAVMGGSYSACNMTNENYGCDCAATYHPDACGVSVNCPSPQETDNNNCGSPSDGGNDGGNGDNTVVCAG